MGPLREGRGAGRADMSNLPNVVSALPFGKSPGNCDSSSYDGFSSSAGSLSSLSATATTFAAWRGSGGRSDASWRHKASSAFSRAFSVARASSWLPLPPEAVSGSRERP
ncbi:hypothetical protein GUJ93_ZPchr0013g34161 [Zizania palustris]|uniref:Uncharacterized protein n=1 Tax=Zizania palustris TaxID=103762 RepID=A0A8J6C6F3_ZIZPA|nr:hypothetical protein GUJ93_ZPchr0013g34161 [Zizania palustris]